MITFATRVANVCGKRGSALQGRMQCTAGAVAVHCGDGCSALRLRWVKTGTEIVSPVLDYWCPLKIFGDFRDFYFLGQPIYWTHK